MEHRMNKSLKMNKNPKILTPIVGCFVKEGNKKGCIIAHSKEKGTQKVRVKWVGDKREDWVDVTKLSSGFMLGMDVQEVPYSKTRKSLGEGVVIESRTIGGREQELVDYYTTGRKHWIPYENLKVIKSTVHKFIQTKTLSVTEIEKFRLKNLSWAIENWHENTGSMTKLRIDPLPHQIQLVHHIISSGHLNWLIADDVGLGKTIEVGMLIAALKQQKRLRRILLITPSGLMKQWQEELYYKFRLGEFKIYGYDFKVNQKHQWQGYNHVIGSIDQFKGEYHLESLLSAENWDLIVIDEAHRLSRRQWGKKFDSSDRFKLAAKIREKTDSLILLTATPHQGMQDKFQALLELLRKDLVREIRDNEERVKILPEMIIRNNKSEVVNSNGEFIFHGTETISINVSGNDESNEFDKQLQKYIQKGYRTSEEHGDGARAIGFVMTIFRKLTASSIAAIQSSLKRRHSRIVNEAIENNIDLYEDDRFNGEIEENYSEIHSSTEFFSGELSQIEELLELGEKVLKTDLKLSSLQDEVIPRLLQSENVDKILIFTEYKATQEYLRAALYRRYGEKTVSLINGSMHFNERENAIRRFENQSMFLISTEAGGEGINLQKKCFVMINYDLPWNPMRLVQRIGRLYRYGQNKKVVVCNMHSESTLDANIINLLYNRIHQVVSDMASVAEEYSESLEADILGQFAELVDVEDIIHDAFNSKIQRTQDTIDKALEIAKNALKEQNKFYKYFKTSNDKELRNTLEITLEHVEQFVLGMTKLLSIKIVTKKFNDRVWQLELPENILKEYESRSKYIDITFDRDLSEEKPTLEMIDMESTFLQWLMQRAQSYKFGGQIGLIQTEKFKAIFATLVRWQNDQGVRNMQEYDVFALGHDNDVYLNPKEFSKWLLQRQEGNSQYNVNDQPHIIRGIKEAVEQNIHERLGKQSNEFIHPENFQHVTAGWGKS